MAKLIVFLVAAAIGFYASSSFTSDVQFRADQQGGGIEGINKAQCIRQVETVAPAPHRAPDICGCMLSEFKARGLEVTDTFGSDFGDMKEITRSCIQVYAS